MHAFPKGKPALWSLRNAPQQQHIPGDSALSPWPRRKNICNWGEIQSAAVLEEAVWGGTVDIQKETGGKIEAQQLMTFQKPERWQSEGFPALRPQISPLSLGPAAELRTTHSTGAHFPPCWQLLIVKMLGAWARWKSKRKKEDSLYIQYVFRWLQLRGQHSHLGLASPTANSWAPPPSRQHQTQNTEQPRSLHYRWTTRPAPWCVWRESFHAIKPSGRYCSDAWQHAAVTFLWQ